MKIKEEAGDKLGLVDTYTTMGSFYYTFNYYKEALEYYQKAYLLANELKMPESQKASAEGLSQTYSKLGDYKRAYTYQLDFIAITDSIYKKESLKKTTQLEMQLEFERREKQQEFEQKQKDLFQQSRLKRQRIINYSLFIGLILMLLLAFVIYRSYKSKSETNKILEKQKHEVMNERDRAERLLLNILPERTAEELKKYGRATSKQFAHASVMFADFVDFTLLCEEMNPLDLIYELDAHFGEFDNIVIESVGHIEKVKTIGDSYMCAGGIPYANKSNPIDLTILGLQFQKYVKEQNELKRKDGKPEWKLRLGINTGPLITGVVGTIKFGYDIWGDTVNVASRMESSGEADKVNVSGTTYDYIKEYFDCTYRGEIPAKNKGKISMYFVNRIRPEYSEDEDGIFPNGRLISIINSM